MPSSGEVPPRLERHEQARADASHVLAGDSNNAAAWRDLGNALSGLKRHEGAIAVYDRAIALAPDNAANWRDRGMAMVAIGQRKEALASIDKALALDPRDAHAWTIRARILSEFQRFAEAVEACDRAIALDPENMNATRLGFHCRLFACDWLRRGRHKRQITACLKGGLHVVTPVIHRGICDSEEESLILARLWAEHYPGSANPLCGGEIYRHDKIRIAYAGSVSVEASFDLFAKALGAIRHRLPRLRPMLRGQAPAGAHRGSRSAGCVVRARRSRRSRFSSAPPRARG
jgi:tetratricopeptide (TPR) repeat protein